MNPFLNSVDIFKAVLRWKWHLLVIALISSVASIVFSGPAFIKPKFKSFAITYPSNLIAYSTESSTEQMLQLLQSSDVREQIIRTFDLMKHYDIDSSKNVHAHSEAIKMYEENVNISKTEFESVKIEVWDTDPFVASAMIDSIILFGDKKARSLQRKKSTEVLVLTGDQVNRKKAELDSMETLLKDYSLKYGLLDYKIQAKEYSRAYALAVNSNNTKGINENKAMLKILAEEGEDFNSLTEHIWRIRGAYNDLKILYDNAYKDVKKELTYANVVTNPIPADKKSYPVRWLIVVISVATSLSVSFFILLMLGPQRNIGPNTAR
jgi:hypothetical protein